MFKCYTSCFETNFLKVLECLAMAVRRSSGMKSFERLPERYSNDVETAARLPGPTECLLLALNSSVPRRSKWSGIETTAGDLPVSSAPPPLTDAVKKVLVNIDVS
jgi:hypothetical protein